jgi:hypothetical protein
LGSSSSGDANFDCRWPHDATLLPHLTEGNDLAVSQVIRDSVLELPCRRRTASLPVRGLGVALWVKR